MNKNFNVRIQNKIDTYENWNTNNPVLLSGEICGVVVPAESGAVVQEPALLFKVGDGTSAFDDLQFTSAKAADVYDWAKAAVKPSYTAAEISGLSDYISGKVQDTDTQYRIVKVDEYTYKLQSKPLGGTFADVEGGTMVIPQYDDTDVKASITALEDLIGETAVVTQISNAVSIAKTELIGKSTDAKDTNTIYGAKKYADEVGAVVLSDANAYADNKVASVKAADKSVGVSGTATAPVVGVNISKDATNKLILVDDGLKVEVPTGVDYGVTVTESIPEGFAKAYTISQAATGLNAVINIPKDMVVSSGKVVENPEGQTDGTYLELTLANATNDKVYIDVSSIIRYVTTGSKVGDQIMIDVSEDYEITATLSDGSVAKTQLTTDVQTTLNKADSALQKEDIKAGTADGCVSVKDTDVQVTGLGSAAFTDSTAYDATGTANNVKSALIGSAEDASSADTIKATKKYTDEKVKTVSDSVTTLSGKITTAEAEIAKKANDTDLKAIAKTGNVNDLVQTDGDYIIFNCGTSSTVI
ncbi:hypothetical protein AALA22_08750 [Anaerovoracaceae bacterium 41-7]